MTNSTEIICERIARLAERGVFLHASEKVRKRFSICFCIKWLYNREFELVCDTEIKLFSFVSVLPNVAYRSLIDKDLRGFITSRTSTALPPHRRVDSLKAELTYSNKKSAVSLSVTSLDGDGEYAVTTLLNTTKDLFSHIQLYHVDYLYREFGVPEE